MRRKIETAVLVLALIVGIAPRLMAQVSFARHVGAENICPHVTAALVRAQEIHDRVPVS